MQLKGNEFDVDETENSFKQYIINLYFSLPQDILETRA